VTQSAIAYSSTLPSTTQLNLPPPTSPSTAQFNPPPPTSLSTAKLNPHPPSTYSSTGGEYKPTSSISPMHHTNGRSNITPSESKQHTLPHASTSAVQLSNNQMDLARTPSLYNDAITRVMGIRKQSVVPLAIDTTPDRQPRRVTQTAKTYSPISPSTAQSNPHSPQNDLRSNYSSNLTPAGSEYMPTSPISPTSPSSNTDRHNDHVDLVHSPSLYNRSIPALGNAHVMRREKTVLE